MIDYGSTFSRGAPLRRAARKIAEADDVRGSAARVDFYLSDEFIQSNNDPLVSLGIQGELKSELRSLPTARAVTKQSDLNSLNAGEPISVTVDPAAVPLVAEINRGLTQFSAYLAKAGTDIELVDRRQGGRRAGVPPTTTGDPVVEVVAKPGEVTNVRASLLIDEEVIGYEGRTVRYRIVTGRRPEEVVQIAEGAPFVESARYTGRPVGVRDDLPPMRPSGSTPREPGGPGNAGGVLLQVTLVQGKKEYFKATFLTDAEIVSEGPNQILYRLNNMDEAEAAANTYRSLDVVQSITIQDRGGGQTAGMAGNTILLAGAGLAAAVILLRG